MPRVFLSCDSLPISAFHRAGVPKTASILHERGALSDIRPDYGVHYDSDGDSFPYLPQAKLLRSSNISLASSWATSSQE